MTFLIGTMVGAVVGIGTMCFMVVAAEEDRQLEKARKRNRCPFCGGKLSEIRMDADGREYRYCFGCFHEYEVNE